PTTRSKDFKHQKQKTPVTPGFFLPDYLRTGARGRRPRFLGRSRFTGRNNRLAMNGVFLKLTVLMQFIIEGLNRDPESVGSLSLVAVEVIQRLQDVAL